MTLIKEHKGKIILSNYNPDAVEKEIIRLTDELEQAQKLISMYRETLKQVNRSYGEIANTLLKHELKTK